ncbi:hypothetical protein BVI1335_1520013 [Burkholderia vietnamiensis]|nr:hypothetical protein BVI1335_1520013 [Burkholderia vietnamiensis]
MWNCEETDVCSIDYVPLPDVEDWLHRWSERYRERVCGWEAALWKAVTKVC